jgi:hypothetical protein
MPNYTGLWINWHGWSCLIKEFVAGWYEVVCGDVVGLWWLTPEGVARLLANPWASPF